MIICKKGIKVKNMKKIILFGIVLIFVNGIFIYSSRSNNDLLSLKNISKLHVMIKEEMGVREKNITENFNEIEKMFNELNTKRIESDLIIGYELAIIGYNKKHRKELMINISGDYVTINGEYFICDHDGINNLITYFKNKILI